MSTSTEPSLPRPLALWLAFQLASLGVSAGGWPIFARHPDPPQALALAQLLVVQSGLAGMLFPVLFSGWRNGLGILTTILPLLLLAGWMANTPTSILAGAIGMQFMWLLTLLIWANLLSSPRYRAMGVCLATLLTLGGGLLYYLGTEFSRNRSHGMFGPLVCKLAWLQGDSSLYLWVFPAALLICSASVLFICDKLTTISPPTYPQ